MNAEIPKSFVEATTEGNVRAAHALLKEGIALERRGDDDEARTKIGRAHQLLDQLVKIFDRPKNDSTGRAICPICESKHIMPNGRCPQHGGE